MLHDLSVLDEVKIFPHCKQKMSCCDSPPIHVGDGLGWGADVMFVCLNDECPLFVRGWEQIERQYGHSASYRYMELPGSTESNAMMVGTKDAFKGFVVDKESIIKQNKRFQEEKKAVEDLASCVENNNIQPVLALLLDEAANLVNRKKAVLCFIELKDLTAIDPLRNHKFRNPELEHSVNLAIKTVLEATYKKECPHCMEIIKAQAKKCLYCKAEL